MFLRRSISVPADDRRCPLEDDHTPCVKGAREEEKEESEKAFQLKERLERHFERRFVMPDEADLEALSASYSKGVLEIRAPKSLGAEPRRIEIERK